MSVMWTAAIVVAGVQGWLTPHQVVGVLVVFGLVIGVAELFYRLTSR